MAMFYATHFAMAANAAPSLINIQHVDMADAARNDVAGDADSLGEPHRIGQLRHTTASRR